MNKLILFAAIALVACGPSTSTEQATPAPAHSEAKPAEPDAPAEVSLLNVSYDPTRELYQGCARDGRARGALLAVLTLGAKKLLERG